MMWQRVQAVRAVLPIWALACCLCSAHAAPPTVPPRADEWAYRVQPGDTLIGLQTRLLRPGARWQSLQKLNRVANPLRLRPGSVLRIPLALLREEPASAEVLHSHGEVWLERPGSPRQPLVAATALVAGDVLLTGPQSSLSLRYADGSRSLLGPNSRVLLERLARLGASGAFDTRLRLDSGAVDTRVAPAPAGQPAPRFELRTPVVNLGVRGTEFRARTDGSVAQAEVLQGRVAAGPQAVPPGFGVAASPAGVSPPVPLLAAPELSDVPERVDRVPLQFALGRVSGAVRYRAQIYDTQPVQSLLLDGLFEQALAAWIDSPADGRYELRVRGANADGIEGHDARRAFTIKARPEPPILLRPRSGERFNSDQVTLAWSRNPQAASYKLQLSTRADFSPLLLQREGLSDSEVRLAVPLGTLYWRLAAVLADGDTGPWGDALSFERFEDPPLPPAPAALPPQPAADGLLLSWSASPLTGASYQVQVARDPAFTERVLDQKTVKAEVLLPKPEPGAYHVRVRTIGADGRAGTYGSTQVVEVPRSWWWLWLLPLLLLL